MAWSASRPAPGPPDLDQAPHNLAESHPAPLRAAQISGDRPQVGCRGAIQLDRCHAAWRHTRTFRSGPAPSDKPKAPDRSVPSRAWRRVYKTTATDWRIRSVAEYW